MVRRQVTRKRNEVAVPAATLAAPQVSAPVGALDLALVAPAGFAALVIAKNVAALELPTVTWEFALAPAPCERVLTFGEALAMGTTAKALPALTPATLPGAVQKTISGPVVEYGLQTAQLHEYFLTKGGGCQGVVQVRRKEDGSWGATLAKTMIPFVLSKQAVEEGIVPPPGTHGLPESLARCVPAEYRYWKATTPDEVRAVRDALVETGFFDEDLVKVVDGDIRLCVKRLYLFEPDAESGDIAKSAAGVNTPLAVQLDSMSVLVKALGAVHARKRMIAPWRTGADVMKSLGETPADALAIISPPRALESDVAKVAESVALVVSALTLGVCKSAWVVDAPDALETRVALAKLGRVFKMLTSDASGRVLVASFPLASDESIQYLASTSAPVAKSAATPEAVAEQFHEAYERLAPSFGYQTNAASAKPWGEVPENNRKLMTAVCAELLSGPLAKAASKKEVEHQGITVKIDRPKGFVQTGKDDDGNKWERTYQTDYGFVPRTMGGDGEALDVYLGPNATAPSAFFVHQNKADGSFDEFKAMLGFDSPASAKAMYLAHTPEKFFGHMTEVPIAQVKALLNLDPQAVSKALILANPRAAIDAVSATFDKYLTATYWKRVAKADAGEERYVVGIVLEPDIVDAQKDTYSAADIRKTAHEFMERYRTIGLMHKGAINDKVKILESFIAPSDFDLEGVPVKKGTWLLAVRVLDDKLWKAVKDGELTGYSIGGTAVRTPNATPSA